MHLTLPYQVVAFNWPHNVTMKINVLLSLPKLDHCFGWSRIYVRLSISFVLNWNPIKRECERLSILMNKYKILNWFKSKYLPLTVLKIWVLFYFYFLRSWVFSRFKLKQRKVGWGGAFRQRHRTCSYASPCWLTRVWRE